MPQVRSLLRFLWPQPVPVKVRILERDPFRVTVAEWRDDPDLCRAAKNAMSNPLIRQMLDTVRNSHLASWALSPDFTLEERAIFAAKCEGYGLALNDLESLGLYREPTKDVEANYAPENADFTEL